MSEAAADDRLTQLAAKGDGRAFAAIFRRYHQGLYRYCLAIVGDSQDAQDALQNTMVKVLRALPGEERQIELKPWLYRIAHNESIELLRRRRDTRQLDTELAAPGSGLVEEAASKERLRRLISDLDELPERQRGALVMRELAGLDFAEIGTALGTSSAVARQTLYEARLSLRGMDEGRDMSCEAVTRAISDGDGRVIRRRDLRAHLRNCASCRRFRDEVETRECDLAALSPLPAAAAAGLLQGLLGGHEVGGGLAGTLGGGATKSLGSAAALKGAATVAVVAAFGVSAADRGGLIDVGLPDRGGSKATQVHRQPSRANSPRATTVRVPDSSVARAEGGAAVSRDDDVSVPRVAKPGTGSARAASPTDGDSNAEAVPLPPSEDSPVAHPHGKGHEKQLPSASEHGQQTAADHKASEHGQQTAADHKASEHGQQTAADHKASGQGSAPGASADSHPEHPPRPSHPVHPLNPSVEKGPSSPPSGVAPGGNSEAGSIPQPAAEGEAPSGHETGKKPERGR